jgi:ubiquitin C-terminal hydrolase
VFDAAVCERLCPAQLLAKRPLSTPAVPRGGRMRAAATPTRATSAAPARSASYAPRPVAPLPPLPVLPATAPCGFINLVNTCFANSALQLLLSSCAELGFTVGNTLVASGAVGASRAMTESFVALEAAALARSLLVPLRLREFMRFGCGVQKFRRDAACGQTQEDTAAYLQTLLYVLFDGCSTVPAAILPAVIYADLAASLIDGRTEAEQAALQDACVTEFNASELRQQASRSSALEAHCVGWYKRVRRCASCNHSSIGFEQFSVMRVPVPAAAPCTLAHAIDRHFPIEVVDGFACPACATVNTVQSHTEIWSLPDVLFIEMLRYRFVSIHQTDKVVTPVDVPLRFVHPVAADAEFVLTGMITHDGQSTAEGHYLAHVVRAASWYRCNDSVVSPSTPETATQTATTAYVLVFVKKARIV